MIDVSDNIFLRFLKFDDAQDVFNIIDNQRDYLREWLPFVDTTHRVEDTQAAMLVFNSIENPQFCILYEDKLVGVVGFKETQRLVGSTEIGYWLSQDFQGKGIMTQSVVKLLEYAFLVMNMHRVIIKVAVANTKSRIIPEQIGFVQEGIERESLLLVDNKRTDVAVYSLLKSEYLEK